MGVVKLGRRLRVDVRSINPKAYKEFIFSSQKMIIDNLPL